MIYKSLSFVLVCLFLTLSPARPVAHASSKPAAISATDMALTRVRHSVALWEGRPGLIKFDGSHEFATSVAIMNYVQSTISPEEYSHEQVHSQTLDLEDILNKQSGICGHHSFAFLSLARKLGLEARSVDFYYTWPRDNSRFSHTTTEVFWGGKWHFLDSTWGTFYTRNKYAGERPKEPDIYDVLSINEVRSLNRPWEHAVSNNSRLFHMFNHITDPDLHVYLSSAQVMLGKAGTLLLSSSESVKVDGRLRLSFYPEGVPTHIGHVSDYGGKRGNMRVKLNGLRGFRKLVISANSMEATKRLLVHQCGKTETKKLTDVFVATELELPLNGDCDEALLDIPDSPGSLFYTKMTAWQ